VAESVNVALRDAQIDHAVNLRAYSNNVVRRIITILNRADAALFTELITKLETMDPERFTIKRLEVMLESVRDLNHTMYAEVDSTLREEISGLTALELQFQEGMLARNMPPSFDIARVSVTQAYAGAMSRPFQGALLSEFLKDQEASKARLIRRTIADGYVQNRTTDQIVRDLRGTRENKYRDGALEITRREAAAVVRTALSHTAHFAKDLVTEANEDILKGLQWLSTLDNRTTPQCQMRDGKTYTLDHKPIDHEFPWGAGPGRLHWQCRSTYVQLTKSWKELGATGDVGEWEDFDPGTRSAMDGQVPAKTTYEEWLADQTPARQRQVLGDTRAKLFSEGNLSLEDMRNASGEDINLDVLRKRNADAFKRAGL
jgi:SPP1 gp7 family putative phage head morphogenesis protein